MLQGKPLIALLEPEARNGGISVDVIRTLLDGDEWASGFSLEDEMASLGFPALPTGGDVITALLARDPIEWSRFSALYATAA